MNHLVKKLFIFAVITTLGGCALHVKSPDGKKRMYKVYEGGAYKQIKTFNLPGSNKPFEIGENVLGDGFYIKPSPKTHGETIDDMSNFYNATTLGNQNRVLVLLYGATNECDKAHWLIDFDKVEMKIHKLDTCGTEYKVSRIEKGVYLLEEINQKNPRIFFYSFKEGLSEGRLLSEWIDFIDEEKKQKKEKEKEERPSDANHDISNNQTSKPKNEALIQESSKEELINKPIKTYHEKSKTKQNTPQFTIPERIPPSQRKPRLVILNLSSPE